MKTAKNQSRPRDLFLDAADLPGIRDRVRLPVFQAFWDECLRADLDADRKFIETGVALNNHWDHMARLCRILQREAFVHLVTGGEARGALAVLALEKILQFPKWDYFLEAGKYVFGLQMAPMAVQSIVLAYPWIETLLSERTKEETLEQLAVKGCEPCRLALWGMLHKEEVKGWGADPESLLTEKTDMRKWPWILSRTNLRAVPMGALGLGALFLSDRHPRAAEWMKAVRETFDDFHTMYEKDGSYPEGTGYANYTSSEMIQFLYALERRTGEDWAGAVNWRGLMDFVVCTRMPSAAHPEGHVNFGDGGSGFFPDIGFWVARKYRDGAAQYAALHHAVKNRVFSLLFYDPSVEPEAPVKDWRLARFDIGWVVVTEGPEKDDFLVALRSGGPANHEHADRNSLILKCLGENMLTDPRKVPYGYRHPAWRLRTSPAHNTVLIDGRGHQYHDGHEGTNPSDAAATVTAATRTADHALVTSDATQAYRLVDGNVERVTRTFLAVPAARVLVVVDGLRTAGGPAEFGARWFLDNEDGKGRIEINGNRFVFRRPGARLAGIAACDRGVRLAMGRFPVPEDAGIYPYLDVSGGEAAVECAICSAFVVAESGGPLPALDLDRTADGWTLAVEAGGRRILVDIGLRDALPRLELRQ